MASFWGSSVVGSPEVAQPNSTRIASTATASRTNTPRCPDFIAFLAIVFEATSLSVAEERLLSQLTSASPEFEDVSLGGASFGVRKVRTTSFPQGIAPEIFNGRDVVVVKQPKIEDDGDIEDQDLYSEIATELQILRHPSVRKHANIIDFLAVMFHNVRNSTQGIIVPALVLEYAEFGNIASYQADGLGRSVPHKVDICRDTALGLQALHEAGVIHGDVKSENLLVCRHSSREFIVKLSDFGFSMSIHDETPHLIGHTRYFEAPECSRPLNRRYLTQLDIYSFGILLYTVFKNGTRFFETEPIETRDSNIGILKTSGLITMTTQLNLLRSMKDERASLFIICRILNYSLQPDPAKRFRSMSQIAALLSFAKPSDLDLHRNVDDPLYKPHRMTIEGFNITRLHLSTWLKQMIEKYTIALQQDTWYMPMLNEWFLERAEIEIDMFHGTIEPGANYFDFIGAHNLGVVRDTLGLLPEKILAGNSVPALSGQETPSKSTENNLRLSSNFMPDIPRISDTLCKAPMSIQASIINGMMQLSTSIQDSDRAKMAKFNLACIHAGAIGVQVDTPKAQKLMLDAAHGGLGRAQTGYVLAFCSHQSHPYLNTELYLDWLCHAAEDGDFRVLSMLEEIDPDRYLNAQKQFRLNGTFLGRRLPFDAANSFRTVLPLESPDTSNWISWRQLLLRFAAINDNHDLAASILSSDMHLLDQKDSLSQTPLLAACQFGSIGVAKLLIIAGADINEADQHGITPMHWLVAFCHEKKSEVISLLEEKAVNVDAWAQVSKTIDDADASLRTTIGPPWDGTPLHWAVRCNDFKAVELLLSLGSDPLYRGLEDQANSAFENSCGLFMSKILKRFLVEPQVLTAVNGFRTLQGGGAAVTPLFWCVSGGYRWPRMLRHGPRHTEAVDETIALLIEHGATLDGVLQVEDTKMTAVFAAAFHGCSPEVMRALLAHGSERLLESRFGSASSGGTPLFLAITDRHYDIFTMLVEKGADIMARDMYGLAPVHRAAKENDDVFFVSKLIDTGAIVDLEDDKSLTPFWIAAYAGNLKVARYLYDNGADRDSTKNARGLSILGKLIQLRSRNAAVRIKFLLSLPDRRSDGFIVNRGPFPFSALHFAVPLIPEDPELAEICRITISLLLSKYSEKKYLNSTDGPHHLSVIGAAVEVGNYKVIKLLLEAGADPSIPDEYGRTPLDLLYWRYCYPAKTEAMKAIDPDGRLKVLRTLNFVNRNTSEVLSLLKSYNAKDNVFRFPGWHQSNPGYRDVEWVIARLRENRDKEEANKNDVSMVPDWGGLPITIPERPMQFTKTESSELAKD